MGIAIAIATLLNALTPGIASIITLVRHSDGTISILTYLDDADKNFASDIQKAADFMKAHKP